MKVCSVKTSFKQVLKNLEDNILLHGFIKQLHTTKNGWVAGRTSREGLKFAWAQFHANVFQQLIYKDTFLKLHFILLWVGT